MADGQFLLRVACQPTEEHMQPVIHMKQFSCDKCAISVKISSELFNSSILNNTRKFFQNSTACFGVNRMTCLLQLLTMHNLLALHYCKTFVFTFIRFNSSETSDCWFELHTVVIYLKLNIKLTKQKCLLLSLT